MSKKIIDVVNVEKELKEVYGINVNVEGKELKELMVLKCNKVMKNLSSKKCLWLKKKGIISNKEYENGLNEILKSMELVRSGKSLIEGIKELSYLRSREDIEKMSLIEIEKNLNSVRSKKSRLNIEDINGLKELEKIEEIYLSVKDKKKIDDNGYIEKIKILDLVKLIENKKSIKKDEIIRMLNELI